MSTSLDRIVQAFAGAGILAAPPDRMAVPLTGVTDDSRAIGPGMLFCAVKGTAADGHAFVANAVERGAAAVIVSRPVDVSVPVVIVSDDRMAAALAAAEWYEHPGSALTLVGVTGTNGKSTTVNVIRHLSNQRARAASIGTLGAFDGKGEAVYREGLTTPGAIGLQATLAELVKRGSGVVVMEVSSHALAQRRVDGLSFQAAVFTNLTHDHLDYHTTLGEYLAAKQRLVEYLADDGVQVVNLDESVWNRLPQPCSGLRITYGLDPAADVQGSDVQLEPDGTVLTIRLGSETRRVRSPLLGGFNVSNVLAATACAWGLDVDVDTLVERIAAAPQVPGRMERLVTEPYLILRDYAHTPDALQRAIDAARPLARNRLYVLFGCGGDRDRKKREPMGRIAVHGADVAILTSDNPRTEDADAILDEIAVGMEGHAYVRVVDRRQAIKRAIEMLEDGDCLLLAGKGHETYQVVGTQRLPFDEQVIVRDLIGGATA